MGLREAAQSPGPALCGPCLTLEPGCPEACVRPGKGDRLEMQPHSRKQSPEGMQSCDITSANLSSFLKAFA